MSHLPRWLTTVFVNEWAGSAPALTAPAAGAVKNTTTPAFTWTGVGGAAKYHIQIDDDIAFGSPVVDDATLTTNSYTPLVALDVDTVYYWRVRAVNSGGTPGVWSAARTLSFYWYISGGIAPANCIAAYQPMGAASLADSYINLADPGNFDITVGVVPRWFANVGWVFNGIDQYLKTGVVFEGDHTVIVGFRSVSADTNGIIVGGQTHTGMFIQPYYLSKIGYNNGSYVAVAPGLTEGVIAIAGSIGYRDGVEDVTGLTVTTNVTRDTYVGCRNNSGVAGIFRDCEVYALAFYDTTLTAPQVAAVTARMAALPGTYAQNPLYGVSGQTALLGEVLNFERDQAWSCGFTYQKDATITGTGMIFTNAPYPSPAGDYPCYEIFVNVNNVYVRFIHDVSIAEDMQVYTSDGGLTDAKVHRVWVTYDGSSDVSGIKIYIDGVEKALSTINNNLTGSIKTTGQNFTVAAQRGYENTLYLRGRLQNLVLDTVVRDAAYIAANSAPYSIPLADPGVRQLLLRLDEGSGLTAYDTSGNGYNATLSSAAMWYQNV